MGWSARVGATSIKSIRANLLQLSLTQTRVPLSIPSPLAQLILAPLIQFASEETTYLRRPCWKAAQLRTEPLGRDRVGKASLPWAHRGAANRSRGPRRHRART